MKPNVRTGEKETTFEELLSGANEGTQPAPNAPTTVSAAPGDSQDSSESDTDNKKNAQDAPSTEILAIHAAQAAQQTVVYVIGGTNAINNGGAVEQNKSSESNQSGEAAAAVPPAAQDTTVPAAPAEIPKFTVNTKDPAAPDLKRSAPEGSVAPDLTNSISAESAQVTNPPAAPEIAPRTPRNDETVHKNSESKPSQAPVEPVIAANTNKTESAPVVTMTPATNPPAVAAKNDSPEKVTIPARRTAATPVANIKKVSGEPAPANTAVAAPENNNFDGNNSNNNPGANGNAASMSRQPSPETAPVFKGAAPAAEIVIATTSAPDLNQAAAVTAATASSDVVTKTAINLAPAATPPASAASQTPLANAMESMRENVNETAASIVRQISLHLRAGASELRLRLDPPGLGELRIRFVYEAGKVRARVRTELESTASLVRERSDELRASMREAGIHITDLDIGAGNAGARERRENFREALEARTPPLEFVNSAAPGPIHNEKTGVSNFPSRENSSALDLFI
ncbi:MAG: flagellar hook-length control protein FliK [Planctomycetes bacterium]|nr:flagellar hook-length control protein FliK [Planctomycetota bacterium]